MNPFPETLHFDNAGFRDGNRLLVITRRFECLTSYGRIIVPRGTGHNLPAENCAGQPVAVPVKCPTTMYTLTRKAAVEVEFQQQIAYGVELEVNSDNADYSPAVFVMQAKDIHDPEEGAWFTAVATPRQLDEYPVDPSEITNSALQQPYFRTDKITLVSANADDIEILVGRITEDLYLLWANLQALETFTEPEEIIIQ